MSDHTAQEMMVVAAARALHNDDVCFVGIGAPSAACNLARVTHAPDITLVYESGTIGTRPTVLPLSIGDGELCDTALTTVSVPEMFQYWLQGGRISIGFLGAAQIDRFGNINTTVIGGYAAPRVRLPGGGGAPEIASHSEKVYVIANHSTRTMVEQIDFVTSLGFGRDGNGRRRHGLKTQGPALVITDLCLMEPGADHELEVTSLHPGVTTDRVRAATGWDIRIVPEPARTPTPTVDELTALRHLYAATDRAHGGDA